MGSVLQVAVAAGMAVVLMLGMILLSLSQSPGMKAHKASRGIALEVPMAELEKLTGQPQNKDVKE